MTPKQKKKNVVHGENTVSDKIYQKWFAKFCVRFFLLLNSSLWLVESDSNQIKTLLENNQPLIWGIDLETYNIADKY